MVVIQHADWTVIISSARAESAGRRLHEVNRDTATAWLLQLKLHPGLRIFAKLKCPGIRWWIWIAGQDVLMLLHFARGIFGPVHALIEPAKLVMAGGMLWLKL